MSRQQQAPKPNVVSENIDKGEGINVMSYNVNFGLTVDASYEGSAMEVVNAIKDAQPDICCMQETNEAWQTLFEENLEKEYPYQLFRHDEGGWYAGGMGVISKYPFKEMNWIPPKSNWFYTWILHAETPLGKLQFLNLHLRPGMDANSSFPSYSAFQNSKDHRLVDIQHWWEYLDTSVPTIALGDFNESHNGIFGGKSCNWLETEKGMKDAINEFEPNTPTWNWPLKLFTLRARFDHIFYDATQFTCTNAKVLNAGTSDHLPVVANLKLNK